jgi:hypothetical protein
MPRTLTAALHREEDWYIAQCLEVNTRDFRCYRLSGVFGSPGSVSVLVSVLSSAAAGYGHAELSGGARAGGGSTGRVPRTAGALPPFLSLFLLVRGYPPGWNRVISTGPLCVGLVAEACGKAGRDFWRRAE